MEDLDMNSDNLKEEQALFTDSSLPHHKTQIFQPKTLINVLKSQDKGTNT